MVNNSIHTAATSSPVRHPRNGTPTLARLVILLAVMGSLWRVVPNDFGGFDDDANVARSPYLNPPTMQSLRHFWTTPADYLYVPVAHTFWWATAKLHYDASLTSTPRLNPHYFHLLNLILHLVTALAAFEVIRHCVRDMLPAIFGTLFFALHPVQVESVAWISGTKDVLGGMFAMLALWQFLRSSGFESRFWSLLSYATALLAFALATLSKPNVVVLPIIAVVLEVALFGRAFRAAVWRALPMFFLAGACAVWTRAIQPENLFDVVLVPLVQRPLVALDAIAFYLWKLAFPLNLGVHYGRTPRDVLASPWVWLTATFALGAIALVWFFRRRFPLLFIGGVIFVVALLPVLGLVPFGSQLYSTVADHYLYFAMIGPALGVAGFFGRFIGTFRLAAPIPLVIGLATLSNLQARHWRDGMTIFSHALEVSPQSWIAHRQVAEELAARGQLERAIEHAKRAVELNDRALIARLTFASKLALAGETEAAIDAYEAALDLDPHNAIVNVELGNLFFKLEHFDRAIDRYRAALDAHPGSPIVHANLAIAYEQSGQLELAQHYFEAALRLAPHDTDAQQGLQRVTARLRQ